MSSIEAAPRLTACPFVVPVVADRLWLYPVGAYCRRPDSRLRIPARQTVERFCTSSYEECDGYRASAPPGVLRQACHE